MVVQPSCIGNDLSFSHRPLCCSKISNSFTNDCFILPAIIPNSWPVSSINCNISSLKLFMIIGGIWQDLTVHSLCNCAYTGYNSEIILYSFVSCLINNVVVFSYNPTVFYCCFACSIMLELLRSSIQPTPPWYIRAQDELCATIYLAALLQMPKRLNQHWTKMDPFILSAVSGRYSCSLHLFILCMVAKLGLNWPWCTTLRTYIIYMNIGWLWG